MVAAPSLSKAQLITLADQCVKCAYCLPACPTFALSAHEAESPRGRIALIQGWAGGVLVAQGAVAQHLDHCLECRACEAVCPSLVQFGTLIDSARTQLIAEWPWWRRWWRQARLTLLSQPKVLKWLAHLAAFYWRLGIGAIATRAGIERQPFLAVVHRLSRRFQPPLPQTSHPPAAVGLFLGCVARVTQQDTQRAITQLLTALQIPWTVPQMQGCCGAMLRHNGFAAAADQQTHKMQSFQGTWVGYSSACVAELQQQSIHSVEICRFLVDAPQLATIQYRPLHGRVAVHEPCSHRHLLRDTAAIYALLAIIPELMVMPMGDAGRCCGAAGSYLLDHPDTAATLGASKVQAIQALQPDIVVTTNSGCALHLEAQLRAAGISIPVLHPVELLARQLPC